MLKYYFLHSLTTLHCHRALCTSTYRFHFLTEQASNHQKKKIKTSLRWQNVIHEVVNVSRQVCSPPTEGSGCSCHLHSVGCDSDVNSTRIIRCTDCTGPGGGPMYYCISCFQKMHRNLLHMAELLDESVSSSQISYWYIHIFSTCANFFYD